MSLNETLVFIRVFHNESQSNLCRDMEISRSYISEVESGKKAVTINILEKYSIHFDIPISSILELFELMNGKKKTNKQKSLIKNLCDRVSYMKLTQDKFK